MLGQFHGIVFRAGWISKLGSHLVNQAHRVKTLSAAKLGYLLGVVLTCMSLISCLDRQSSFFSGLDANFDNKISFAEWWHYYGSGQKDLISSSRRDFYLADCDKDDLLSWDEYWNHRKRHNYCPHFDALRQAGINATLVYLISEEQRLLEKTYSAEGAGATN
ncbi:hypothetical protein KT71_003316 [Congregibacter litoralis KT71]|uniref:EF-hand domain-containing protein n=1 Tax=Congregibacter litoralis KT71 TaxID=314285 RepID=V7HUV8_9GAMM|nr:hypothetical protein KT71_003316 [Congregibacter litoralis KT71]